MKITFKSIRQFCIEIDESHELYEGLYEGMASQVIDDIDSEGEQAYCIKQGMAKIISQDDYIEEE